MTVKGLKELVKRERPTPVSPLYNIEHLFEDMWKRPFSTLIPSLWSDVDLRSDVYGIAPIVDIYEEGNEVIVKADLPGMKKEDIKIDIAENMLTISGEKKTTEKIEKKDYYRQERTFGSFCRRFELPGEVDTGKIKAHFENGVLDMRIPLTKEAEKKHTKILIE